MLSRRGTADAATVTLGIGAAVVAMACCAGLQIVAALLAGLALGAILGLGFGAVLLGTLAWISTLIFTRKRHPGGCDERNGQR